MAPTMMRAGTKTNVIPDLVELEVDIRALPGQTAEHVRSVLAEALGDLSSEVEVAAFVDDPATLSPADTPLWAALQRAADALAPEARCIPTLTSGATDARFYRRRGSTAYGFGLFSGRTSVEELSSMFHGDDERVDIQSLGLSTALWESLARDVLT
jgi:acetylornithine deacetylase/succinyl-diaminopimelate desuccinylase-like protein